MSPRFLKVTINRYHFTTLFVMLRRILTAQDSISLISPPSTLLLVPSPQITNHSHCFSTFFVYTSSYPHKSRKNTLLSPHSFIVPRISTNHESITRSRHILLLYLVASLQITNELHCYRHILPLYLIASV
jgi:hypothetical protein